VNQATRQRVQAAARSAGYRYNPLAGALMTQIRMARVSSFQGGLAALDLDEPNKPVFPGPFLRELLAGAHRRAEELSFKLERFSINRGGMSVQRLDTILQSRGIRGILLLPAWARPDFTRLDWSKYAGVYADYLIDRPALHSVCADHYRAMMSLLNRLKEMGFRRPGLVLPTHMNERIQLRWAAAFQAYHLYNPNTFEAAPCFVPTELTAANFSAWFKANKPDVVLAHRGEIIRWMEDCGARVPATHCFLSLNVKLTTTPCTGIDQQPSQIGARAIELIIAQIHRNEYGIPDLPCTTTVPSLWVDGPTLVAREQTVEQKIAREAKSRS
jgi:LacI family transcriptional regulator